MRLGGEIILRGIVIRNGRWNRWWIVVAAILSLIVGQGSINVFAAGVFLKPVAQELGLVEEQSRRPLGFPLW